MMSKRGGSLRERLTCQWLQQQHQQQHQVLSFRTGWARGLRIAPMLKDVPLGVGGEFDDGSDELVAVVWNDLGVEREELVGMSVGHA